MGYGYFLGFRFFISRIGVVKASSSGVIGVSRITVCEALGPVLGIGRCSRCCFYSVHQVLTSGTFCVTQSCGQPALLPPNYFF